MVIKTGEGGSGGLSLWQRLLVVTVLSAALAKWQVYFMRLRVEAGQPVTDDSASALERRVGTSVGAERESAAYEEDEQGMRSFFFPDTYNEPWRPELTKLGDVNFLLTTEQFHMDGAPGEGTSSRAVLTYPLWNKSADADGANRYGLAAQIAEELGIGVYKFPSSMVDTLPTRPPRLRYRSCAVVGNSGELLRGALGGEVDAHDVVIRINGAPTKGFEAHVGNKTTFSFINHAHFKTLATMARRRVPAQVADKGHLVLFESTIYQAYFHIYDQLTERFPPKELAMVIVSPDFTGVSFELWRRLSELVIRETRTAYPHKKPSSGWFATVFAAQMCEQVDLYGFEAYRFSRGTKKATTKYHYFDDVSGFTNVHSFELSIKVFRKLQQMGFSLRLAHPVTGIAGAPSAEA